eukprot:4281360-Prymnesium_polylepis.1
MLPASDATECQSSLGRNFARPRLFLPPNSPSAHLSRGPPSAGSKSARNTLSARPRGASANAFTTLCAYQ